MKRIFSLVSILVTLQVCSGTNWVMAQGPDHLDLCDRLNYEDFLDSIIHYELSADEIGKFIDDATAKVKSSPNANWRLQHYVLSSLCVEELIQYSSFYLARDVDLVHRESSEQDFKAADDRDELDSITGYTPEATKRILHNAESVGVLFQVGSTKGKYPSSSYTLQEKINGKTSDCPPPRFGNQVVPNPKAITVSCVLIQDNIILTTGHELCDNYCNAIVLFGVGKWPKNGSSPPGISEHRLCRKIYCENENELDYALFEIYPPAKRHAKVSGKSSMLNINRIYMLGHPYGLPMKFVDNAKVDGMYEQPKRYYCKLDASAGNSGSPIFDSADHTIIGILTNGPNDLCVTSHPGPIYCSHEKLAEVKTYENFVGIDQMHEGFEKIGNNKIGDCPSKCAK